MQFTVWQGFSSSTFLFCLLSQLGKSVFEHLSDLSWQSPSWAHPLLYQCGTQNGMGCVTVALCAGGTVTLWEKPVIQIVHFPFYFAGERSFKNKTENPHCTDNWVLMYFHQFQFQDSSRPQRSLSRKRDSWDPTLWYEMLPWNPMGVHELKLNSYELN